MATYKKSNRKNDNVVIEDYCSDSALLIEPENSSGDLDFSRGFRSSEDNKNKDKILRHCPGYLLFRSVPKDWERRLKTFGTINKNCFEQAANHVYYRF